MKAYLEYQLFRGLAFFIRSLSLPSVRRLSRAIANIIYYVIPVRRAVTLQHLRYAFPEYADKRIRNIAFESYINVVTTLVEMLWIPNFTDEMLKREVTIIHPEVITNILRRGQGLIFLTGHFGNWELGAFAIARIMGIPMTIIVHPQKNIRVAKIVNDIRSSKGSRTVDWKMGVRQIFSVLRSHGVISIAGDQSGPKEAMFIPFFGRPASTYEGPAAFALKFHVPMLFFFSVRRDDGNYEIHLAEVPTHDLDSGSEENIRELTRRHVSMLEECIRKYPGQWLWQHKRWKHSPPVEEHIPHISR